MNTPTNTSQLTLVDESRIRVPGRGTAAIPLVEPEGPAPQEPGPHQLLSGSISDSNWTRQGLQGFYAGAAKVMEAVDAAIKACQHPSLSDYKPEAAKRKKAEMLRPAITLLDETVAKHRAAAEPPLTYAQELHRLATSPAQPQSELAQLRNDLKAQEARQAALAMDASGRSALVARAASAGDLQLLGALQESLIPLFPDDPGHIARAMDEVAQRVFPWLGDFLRHCLAIRQAVDTRAVELTFLVKGAMSRAGMDYAGVRRQLSQEAV